MSLHVHILGIAGTFMGSLAQLAKQAGFRVSGCDTAVYPPMSEQLEQAGIEWVEGFSADQLSLKPDVFIIGNVVSRGNELMEAILNHKRPFISGPQWLAENILRNKWVLAVAGTHGKTTTSSMLAWILQYAGYQPGYLIGGVPADLPASADLGKSDFFVIEADEYDTAFFDKRSKFLHYLPNTLVINNLEFDHADIFEDLAAIQKQFHHLLRTVPGNGLVVYPQTNTAIASVIERGCWCDQQQSGSLKCLDSIAIESQKADFDAWRCIPQGRDESGFYVAYRGDRLGQVSWSLSGQHNMQNGLHAIMAARHVGVLPEVACEALGNFTGVKRRMEAVGQTTFVKGSAVEKTVTVYDDFAHHPTAIETTLNGLRKRFADKDKTDIVAVIEPRSNTMKLGVHTSSLLNSATAANAIFWFQSESLAWPLSTAVERPDNTSLVYKSTDKLLSALRRYVECSNKTDIHIVVMSNGAFENIPHRIIPLLKDPSCLVTKDA